MKFICQKEDLINGLSVCSKALSSKPTIPVFEGIYLETEENSLTLIASNGQISITTTVACKVLQEGKVLVSGRTFTDIVKRSFNNEIEFTLTSSSLLNIVSGKSKVNISTLDVLAYPKTKEITPIWDFTISNKLLKDMVRGVIFAAAPETIDKPCLTGMYASCSNSILTFVCLDGLKMAIRNTNINSNHTQSIIFYSKTIDEISKIVNDEDETHFSMDDKYIIATCNNIKIVSSVIPGEYINYQNFLPKDYAIKIKINKHQLLNSIERCSIVARQKQDNLICLSIEKNNIIITAKSELGDILDEIDIYQEGGPLRIGFNGNYLVEILRTISEDEIFMSFNNEISPCLITPTNGQDYKYIVLPLRMQ